MCVCLCLCNVHAKPFEMVGRVFVNYGADLKYFPIVFQTACAKAKKKLFKLRLASVNNGWLAAQYFIRCGFFSSDFFFSFNFCFSFALLCSFENSLISSVHCAIGSLSFFPNGELYATHTIAFAIQKLLHQKLDIEMQIEKEYKYKIECNKWGAFNS